MFHPLGFYRHNSNKKIYSALVVAVVPEEAQRAKCSQKNLCWLREWGQESIIIIVSRNPSEERSEKYVNNIHMYFNPIAISHGCYTYCGACAGFAYKQVDPSNLWVLVQSNSLKRVCVCVHLEMRVYSHYMGFSSSVVYRKRVFLLGPSHHVYLPGCALSCTTHYETPLYNLEIDQTGGWWTRSCVIICYVQATFLRCSKLYSKRTNIDLVGFVAHADLRYW